VSLNPRISGLNRDQVSPLYEAISTDRPNGGSLFSFREKVILLGSRK